jgi:hypothetical protein
VGKSEYKETRTRSANKVIQCHQTAVDLPVLLLVHSMGDHRVLLDSLFEPQLDRTTRSSSASLQRYSQGVTFMQDLDNISVYIDETEAIQLSHRFFFFLLLSGTGALLHLIVVNAANVGGKRYSIWRHFADCVLGGAFRSFPFCFVSQSVKHNHDKKQF